MENERRYYEWLKAYFTLKSANNNERDDEILNYFLHVGNLNYKVILLYHADKNILHMIQTKVLLNMKSEALNTIMNFRKAYSNKLN